jgi:hypothetical protein
MNLLPTNLAPLADVADQREGTRWAVSGVQLESLTDGNGMPAGWRATATDTKRLVRVTGPDVTPLENYPDLPGMTTAPNGAVKAIIPTSRWKDFFRNTSKLTKKAPPALRAVAVKMGDEVVTMGATDGNDKPMTQTPIIEGRFPPVDDIMPKKIRTGAHVACFDGRLLAETLAAITAMCPKDDTPAIRFEFWEGYKPALLTTTGENGINIEAIVMPLSFEKGSEDDKYRPVEMYEERLKRLAKSKLPSDASEELNKAKETAHQWRERAEELTAELLAVKAELATLRQSGSVMKPMPAPAPAMTRAERLAAMKDGAA